MTHAWASSMAVDEALEDPRAWTPMAPTEVWRRIRHLGIEASNQGRVRSLHTGAILNMQQNPQRKGWSVATGAKELWVPYAFLKKFMGWN